MSLVFHITSRSHWQQAQEKGIYLVGSLEREGFIHFSKRDQVVRSANKFFAGQSDLVLLCIEPALLQAKLRYEPIETGEQFPHLYGSLNLDAVVQVLPLEPDANGKFVLPESLGE